MNATKVMLTPDPHCNAQAAAPRRVLRYRDCERRALRSLLARFGLELQELAPRQPIPGSYWGDEEAGLIGDRVLVRDDTPLHSILHEACHFICMEPGRRSGLDTDAGGDYDEENAVCYLQILLADHLPDTDSAAMCADMDRWGYTFRLGSARAWFERDAEDARQWLLARNIIDTDGVPAWQLRGHD